MDLLEFIKKSKTMYHAAQTVRYLLLENDFIELNETEKFVLEKGKKYFFTRNNSSVVAFTIPKELSDLSFKITAAHLDSPTFKLKPDFSLVRSGYNMLNTEVYGGPIYSTFMDRPLDICGRVMVKHGNWIETKLLSFDRAMCVIPNLPIHYNRNVNKGVELNPQIDMMPLFSDSFDDLGQMIADRLGVEKEEIISHDLYLSLLDRGTYMGPMNEFIMAPQLDNLESSLAIITSLIESDINNRSVNICCLFDSEEIGSRTRCGADSMMLSTTIDRILIALKADEETKYTALAKSFFVSADNAQAFNPNHASLYDPTNACHVNKGIVIKSAARGSYTSDGYSSAVFKALCMDCDVKYQNFTNKSDIPGGSTLGAIQLSSVSIPAVDIGFAQLAMHSAYETAGRKDFVDMITVVTKFYNSNINVCNDNDVIIKR